MCLLVVCFFFKQKTAYEMRISDWSSDVCSSDLARLFAVDAARLGGLARLGLDAALGALQRFVDQVGQACPRIGAVRLLGAKSAREDDQFAVGRHPAAREQLQPPPGVEIGRAHV